MRNDNFKSGFISIVGRPNVGKSTLLNKILRQKIAIMSDKPQTTRNKIQGILTEHDFQAIFIDTPGIHKPKHKLGEFMNKQATSTLGEVDAILFLVEANQEPGAGDQYIADILKGIKTPIILVLNKVDLIKKDELLLRIDQYKDLVDVEEIIPLSALQGDNVEVLIKEIKKRLPEGPMFFAADQITDHPERFVIAELIREKVLQLTEEEIPHSVAVVVEQIVEREHTDKLFVSAVIYTERKSQKGILIGKDGALLKEVGKRARNDIERLLGSKIYLDLWIKVKKDWRNHAIDLRNFGFHE
ncbi:GTPase Era [Desulfuribacillus alkaliarsenatis]|uniref:GTPase Era n=1 Tax=Desulfuribacillus alkaliarsenatis TaxID=766136 RepID=A0A1E5G0B2_9FIRM|nr:GTPase Era [Desulfuribacillus alkaliarsenatis]OEF96220.1 GTPase Era [Desulfuribacillus alkaliarsenatis]